MGFMDSVFGDKSKAKTSAKAASKEEKTISKNLAAESSAVLPLFKQLVTQQKGQTGINDDLFKQMSGQISGYNQALAPEQQGQMQAGWMQSVQNLGNQDQDIINRAMGMLGNGANATPEQIALIQQATDLATQSGLSDLSRFRDQSFQQIRDNAAGRGLNAYDSPIMNQFGSTGEEFGRQAQQLVMGLRQKQLEEQLAYPLQAGQFANQQLTTASDLANRRAQFQAQLSSEAQQNQQNFGRAIMGAGLGLAQGSSGADALGPLVSQRQFAGGNVSQVNTPSPFKAFTQAAGGAGGMGM